jgi:hypothetical protein
MATESTDEENARLKSELTQIKENNVWWHRTATVWQVIGVAFGIFSVCVVGCFGLYLQLNQVQWKVDQIASLKVESRLQAVEGQHEDIAAIKIQLTGMAKDISDLKDSDARLAQQMADYIAKK